MTLLDLLDILGQATWQTLWVPLLAWTVLALPLWFLLKRSERLHPLAEYRLSQVLLAALPVGLAAAPLFDFTAPPASLPAPSGSSVLVLPAIEPTSTAPATPSSWHWMEAVGLMTGLALVLSLFRLGQLVLDAVAATRVRASLDADSGSAIQPKVDRLTDALGIRRSVQVRVTAEATVPGTLGGLRPTILVPAGLTNRPDALRLTLLHECIHVRRWDDLAHLAERFVGAVFAIHPLVDRLRRQVARARERACDAAVLVDRETSPAFYARLLVAFAEGNARPDPLGALSLSESPSSLTDRLSAMRSSISTVLSSRLALGIALLATGLTLTLGIVACSDVVNPTSQEASPPKGAPSVAAPADTTTYMIVEEQPKCGGVDALQAEVEYPELARKAGIEGRVFVQFVVDQNGTVTNPTVTRGAHKLLNEAALEAVNDLDCKAGRQDGRPVRVKMALPVSFRLSNDSSSASAHQSSTSRLGGGATAGLDAIRFSEKPDGSGSAFPLLSRETRKALHSGIHYPELARTAGMEGRVIVQVTVDKKGHGTNPQIANDQHASLGAAQEPLSQAALQTVKDVAFTPASEGVSLVGMKLGVQFQFELPSADS